MFHILNNLRCLAIPQVPRLLQSYPMLCRDAPSGGAHVVEDEGVELRGYFVLEGFIGIALEAYVQVDISIPDMAITCDIYFLFLLRGEMIAIEESFSCF